MHEPGPPLLLTGPHERNIVLARELGTLAHLAVDRDHADARRLRDHGRFADPDSATHSRRVLEVTHAIVARSADTRFAQAWSSTHTVARHGTVLGWREGEPFVTPYDDCTLVMPSLRQLRPGVTIVRLAHQR